MLAAASLTNSSRALSLSLARKTGQSPRFRPLIVGNWFMKLFYGHSKYPNGIIRYRAQKITLGKAEINPITLNMVMWPVVAAFFYSNIHNTNLFSKIMAPSWVSYHWHHARHGIVPDLNDHSYGSWNYYPLQ